MKMSKFIGFIAVAFIASQAAAQCYTIYDPQNKVLYSGAKSPVPMTLPLHQTLPAIFPNGSMVFDLTASNCAELDTRPSVDLPFASPQKQANDALEVLKNRYENAPYRPQQSAYSANVSAHRGSARTAPGTDVYVRGHMRSNGTYVNSYTRSSAKR